MTFEACRNASICFWSVCLTVPLTQTREFPTHCHRNGATDAGVSHTQSSRSTESRHAHMAMAGTRADGSTFWLSPMSFCPLTCEISRLPGITSSFSLSLYLSWPDESHFSKEPCFLTVVNGMKGHGLGGRGRITPEVRNRKRDF